jgi:hypothetical protein
MGLLKLKTNKKLNGKHYRWGDLYDSWNQTQKDHFDGKLDVYAPIMRNNIQYPSIADQWKADFSRKIKNG